MFLSIVWPATLPLPLEAAKYIYQPQATEVQMESGRVRRRRQFSTVLKTIDVKWVFEDDAYDTFRTFFEDTLENGSVTFALELYGVDQAVSFLNATYSATVAEGVTNVQATLLVFEEAETESYDPPEGLTATAEGPVTIALAWPDPSATNTGFLIQRKTGVGGTWANLQTVGDVVAYDDTTCDPGTTYYYRVAAIYTDGNSEWSNEANATTWVLDAPTDLTAVMVDESSIDLDWTDPSSDNTGFVIQRKTGVGGDWAEIDTVGDVTVYNDTGLDPATTYYYRVAAIYADGNSDWSNEANATTFDPTTCAVTDFAGIAHVAAGGGDTFDCYEAHVILVADDLPNGGTGFTAAWTAGLTTIPYGDDFDAYAAENPITSTLSGGTGMSGNWLRNIPV